MHGFYISKDQRDVLARYLTQEGGARLPYGEIAQIVKMLLSLPEGSPLDNADQVSSPISKDIKK